VNKEVRNGARLFGVIVAIILFATFAGVAAAESESDIADEEGVILEPVLDVGESEEPAPDEELTTPVPEPTDEPVYETASPYDFYQRREDVLPYMSSVPAPDFSLQTTGGYYYGLPDTVGKPVIVLFWTTLSKESLDSLAYLRYVDDYYPDMKVIAINPLPQENGYAQWTEEAFLAHQEWIRAYFNEAHLYSPALIDVSGDVYDMYGCGSTPTAFFIDRDNIIRIKLTGLLTRDTLSTLLAMMRALDY
jgi:hypothetical protein